MASKAASKRRGAGQSTPLADSLSAQFDRVVRLFPDTAVRAFQDTRKRLEATGRAAEKRASQLGRELRAQGKQFFRNAEKLARRQLHVIEGRLAQARRPLQREVQAWASRLSARLEPWRERVEREVRRYLTERMDLASHREVLRLNERLREMERRLQRLEQRERPAASRSVTSPSAAA